MPSDITLTHSVLRAGEIPFCGQSDRFETFIAVTQSASEVASRRPQMPPLAVPSQRTAGDMVERHPAHNPDRFLSRMEKRRDVLQQQQQQQPPSTGRSGEGHPMMVGRMFTPTTIVPQAHTRSIIDIPRPLSRPQSTPPLSRTVSSAADVRQHLLASSTLTSARGGDALTTPSASSVGVVSSSSTSDGAAPPPKATQPPTDWVRSRSALLQHLQAVPHDRKKAFEAPLRSSVMSETQKLLYTKGYLDDSSGFLRPTSQKKMFLRSA